MLTPKQEKFVQELVKGKSQREAYASAYNASKMKDSTIDNKAYLLFQKEEIRARYEELLAECIEDAESIRKTIIDAELAIVKASFGDLFDVIQDEDGTGVVTKPKADLSKFDMRAVKSYRYDRSGRVVFELYDKQPAIATLAELYQIATKEEKDEINIILHKAEGYDE